MNKIKKITLICVLTVAFCWSLAVGSTYALFADESTTNISVSSGTVNVNATLTRPSLFYDDNNGDTRRSWPNGGNVTLADNLGIVKMSPGCSVSFEVIVENSGTLATKWQVEISSDIDIFKYTTFSTQDGNIEFYRVSDKVISTDWQRDNTPEDGKTVETVISITIEFPYSEENTILNGAIYVSVNALQGNAPTPDLERR